MRWMYTMRVPESQGIHMADTKKPVEKPEKTVEEMFEINGAKPVEDAAQAGAVQQKEGGHEGRP